MTAPLAIVLTLLPTNPFTKIMFYRDPQYTRESFFGILYIIVENLNILASSGIKFSLDDFGTGYSNIRRVASLPLSMVKLDKTFANIEEGPKMNIVLKNTIKMLKAMNMKIVVEEIETENLVNRFSDLKCEYIQGYYYSKPVPEKEFVEFIKSNI